MRGGEAAFHYHLTDHLPARHRVRETLEGNRLARAQLKHPTKAAAGARADNDGVGRGDLLQPCGEIRRLAHDHRLRRDAGPDQVADHDQPGSDADANLDRGLGRRQRCPQAPEDGQRHVNRALGIVLMRFRPAEAGEYAVAVIRGDMAAERLDSDAADLKIETGDGTQVLGVESRGEFGRSHHIAEQRRDLAPLDALVASGPGR